MPCLGIGLAVESHPLIRLGAVILLAGVIAGACQIALMVARAARPLASAGGPPV